MICFTQKQTSSISVHLQAVVSPQARAINRKLGTLRESAPNVTSCTSVSAYCTQYTPYPNATRYATTVGAAVDASSNEPYTAKP
jgi:hypothetical protein